MNRKTGEIRMVRGPAMLLPNPIDEVIVRRVLTDRECATWYPATRGARVQPALRAPRRRAGARCRGRPSGSRGARRRRSRGGSRRGRRVRRRAIAVHEPRTIVFNTKYEGVPC